MNETLKAAKLDFCLVGPYLKNFGFSFVMIFVFCAINKSLMFEVFLTVIVSTMLIGYPFSISENHGMEKLYGIMPVSKKHLVIGRYLYTCSIGLMVSLFSPIIYSIILRVLGVTVLLPEICMTAILGFGIFSLYTVFQLPVFYKNGALKGKGLVYIIPFVVYFAVMMIILKFNAIGEQLLGFITGNRVIAVATVLLAFIIAYWISIGMSVRFLQNKEV